MKNLTKIILSSLFIFSFSQPVLAQSTILQAGTFVPGHLPVYSTSSSVLVVQDSGGAQGGGFGIGPSELALTIRSSGTPPFANAGNGPSFTNFCDYDAPTGLGSGYHYLCMSPNSGGGGLLIYGQSGLTDLPLNIVSVGGINLNGSPIGGGGISGPGTTVSGYVPTWNGTNGTSLAAGLAAPASGTLLGSVTAPTVNPATGTPSSATFLRGDGSWAVPAGSGGLTVGTTTITSGTNGRILYDNVGVLGELSVGTGVATALGVNVGTAGAVVVNGGAMGTPSSGTATNLSGTASGLTAGNVTNLTLGGALTTTGAAAPTLAFGTGSFTYTFPASTGTLAELGLAQTWTAVQTFTNSDIRLLGSSTGYTTFTSANAGASNYTQTFQAVSGTVADLDVASQVMTGGVLVTAAALGTISSGTTTINCGTSPLQWLTNGGAFTLAAPSSDSSCIVEVENNGSAGVITFSGFSVGTSTGDAIDTTNGHYFDISIIRIHGHSTYRIAALQ